MGISDFLMEFISTNIGILIALIAVIIALYSSIQSRKSNAIANRALSINEINHANNHENIEGYLIDGEKWHSGGYIFFALLIRLTNNSTQDNSFKDINICLTVVNGELQKTTIKSPIDNNLLKIVPKKWSDYAFAKLPVNIKGKSVFEGVFISNIHKDVLKDNFIESVFLEAITLENTVITVKAHYMRESHEKRAS